MTEVSPPAPDTPEPLAATPPAEAGQAGQPATEGGLAAKEFSVPARGAGAEGAVKSSDGGTEAGEAGGQKAESNGPGAPKKESLAATVLSLLIKSIICAVLLWLFVFQISFVKGESMEQSFHEGDRLVIDKLTYWFCDVERGDVVVFDHVRSSFDAHAADGRPEPEKHEDYIKRVIGLPGDLVRIQRGVVYVNGKPLTEGYAQHTTGSQLEFFPPPAGWTSEPVARDASGMDAVRVRPGCVFVMGDNRGHSTDSRMFGPVKINLIRGKVRIRMLPSDRFRWFSGGE